MATKTFPVAQAFSELPYVAIPLVPVESHQVAAVGYDATTRTLAVRFLHGAGHIYHYPNCDAQVHADSMAAESKGRNVTSNCSRRPSLSSLTWTKTPMASRN